MSLRWQIIITAGLAALLAAGWLWLPAWDGEAVSQDKLERSATATPVLSSRCTSPRTGWP